MDNSTLSSSSPVSLINSSISSTIAEDVLANVSSTVSSLITQMINGTQLAANETFGSHFGLNSNQSILRMADGSAEEAPGAGDESHSSGALYAWIGLGVLLIGIVFVLGFVFVFDKVLRKKFFSSSSTSSGDSESAHPKTENGETPKKKPTDFTKGEANLPEPTKKEEEKEEEDENIDGSSDSLNAKRKRQEKTDEAKSSDVELKPL